MEKKRFRAGDPILQKEDINDRSEFFKVLLSQPLQSFRELVSISAADILDILRGLKEKGVGVSIIHTVDDQGFPMELVQKAVKANMIDGFLSVQGTHNEFQFRPEKYTRAAETLLTAMEKKHSASPAASAGI